PRRGWVLAEPGGSDAAPSLCTGSRLRTGRATSATGGRRTGARRAGTATRAIVPGRPAGGCGRTRGAACACTAGVAGVSGQATAVLLEAQAAGAADGAPARFTDCISDASRTPRCPAGCTARASRAGAASGAGCGAGASEAPSAACEAAEAAGDAAQHESTHEGAHAATGRERAHDGA